MIGAILGVMLATAAQAAEASPPGPQAAPVPASDPLAEAQNNLDQAEQVYMQSCGDRAYAAYDDLCSQLKTQIRQYHIDLDRLKQSTAAKITAQSPKS